MRLMVRCGVCSPSQQQPGPYGEGLLGLPVPLTLHKSALRLLTRAESSQPCCALLRHDTHNLGKTCTHCCNQGVCNPATCAAG